MRPLFVAAAAAFAFTSAALGQEVDASAVSTPWLVTGNTIGGGNFLGTTNCAPLVFKSDGREAMRIVPNLNKGIGTAAPNSPLTVRAATRGRPVLSVTQTSANAGSDSISDATYFAGSVGVYAEAGTKSYCTALQWTGRHRAPQLQARRHRRCRLLRDGQPECSRQRQLSE
jgi:hypothetical protein